MGLKQHLPSDATNQTRNDSKGQVRLPSHVWGRLSRGMKAKPREIEEVVEGIGVRDVPWWRLDIGLKRQHFVRRTVWAKRDGFWRGEWIWEKYDRWYEWNGTDNLHWCNMAILEHKSGAIPGKCSVVPQETLLCMVQFLDRNDVRVQVNIFPVNLLILVAVP